MSEKQNDISCSIPLITIEPQFDNDDIGSLELTTEGMEFLLSTKHIGISILSIIGPSKTGKSLLSDFIIGEQDAFPSSKETKGICIWGKPIKFDNGSILLVLDTEGLCNPKSKKYFDKKIMAICMLISSLVVYNSNENVSNLVETFNSIFKESIKLFDNDNYTNDLTIDDSLKYRKIIDSLAKFSFVLREIEGISENDVIDKLKEELNKSKVMQRKLDYNLCFTLPKINFDDESTFQILKNKIFTIKTNILSSIEPKTINGYQLTGEVLFSFLQTVLDSLNQNKEASIKIRSQFENSVNTLLTEQANQINSQINLQTIAEKSQTKNMLYDTKNIIATILPEQIQKFQSTPIAHIVSSQQITSPMLSISSYILKIYETTFTSCQNQFDALLDKYIAKKEIANFTNVKIDNLNEYFSTYTNTLTDIFTSIFDSLPLNSAHKINTLFSETVTDNLYKVANEMTSQIESIMRENDELKQRIKKMKEDTSNELRLKEDEIYKIRGEFEAFDRQYKTKELEYMNNINIEKEKYSQLEEKYKKDINDLEKKLRDYESLRKSNINQVQSSESNNSQVNLKGSYNKITKAFLDYKNVVDKLDANQNVFIQNIFVDKAIAEIEKKYNDKIDLLSEKNVIEKLTTQFESRIELYKKENKLLKESYENQTRIAEYYKSKYQDLFENLSHVTELLEKQFAKTKNYQLEIELKEKTINELNKKAYATSMEFQKVKDLLENIHTACDAILSGKSLSTARIDDNVLLKKFQDITKKIKK